MKNHGKDAEKRAKRCRVTEIYFLNVILLMQSGAKKNLPVNRKAYQLVRVVFIFSGTSLLLPASLFWEHLVELLLQD